MNKLQWGFVLGALALIQILYFGFDTVQLDKEGSVTSEVSENPATADVRLVEDQALSSLNKEDRDSVTAWMGRAEEGDILSLKQLSSFWSVKSEWLLAGHYTERIAEIDPNIDNITIAANTYATGAEIMSGTEVGSILGGKAITLYDQVLEETGDNFKLELQRALIKIKSPNKENPMQAVLGLVELSEKYPEEAEVFENLGEFSMQTGQWDKAQERLERAYDLNPGRKKTICLLAVVYENIGDRTKTEEFHKLCDQK